jgi:hypothetical protein
MLGNDNRSDPAKKGCTDSLSEDVTDGLAKPVHTVVEERPEGILTRRRDLIQKIVALEWRGLNGKDFFNEQARRCRITLEGIYWDALKSKYCLGSKRTEQTMLVDSEVEVKMIDNLDSIIKDCNCYLLKNIHVRLIIKERVKKGRNKSRW